MAFAVILVVAFLVTFAVISQMMAFAVASAVTFVLTFVVASQIVVFEVQAVAAFAAAFVAGLIAQLLAASFVGSALQAGITHLMALSVVFGLGSLAGYSETSVVINLAM